MAKFPILLINNKKETKILNSSRIES